RKVALLGTGVNPGFILDRLPATLGNVVGRVDRVHASRVVDARTRRLQLQRKVGAGLNEEEFDRGVDDGTIGHVGLMESAALAALGVGLEVDEVDEDIDPVETEEDVQGEGFTVPRGGIVGVHQVARAFHDGKEVAHLELTIALGAPDPRDEIELIGDPGIKCVIPGGVPGDKATAWSAGYRTVVAPPTFPTTLRAGCDLRDGLLLSPGKHLMQAEQSFEYARPIVAGDKLTVRSKVVEVSQRNTPSGLTDVVVIEDE